MKNGIKTGIFLCECGDVIRRQVDLPALESTLKGEEGVECVQSHSQYCLKPGLTKLAGEVEARGLNRVLLGACSDRIMKKKFSKALGNSGLLDSQIEMVNLKDHVALVHDGPKEELTRKAAALLAAGLRPASGRLIPTLRPGPASRVPASYLEEASRALRPPGSWHATRWRASCSRNSKPLMRCWSGFQGHIPDHDYTWST